jgi:hypothetical protein
MELAPIAAKFHTHDVRIPGIHMGQKRYFDCEQLCSVNPQVAGAKSLPRGATSPQGGTNAKRGSK